MTISFWRYSHLALAISSFLFIALASITGVILAFKPVIDKNEPYKVKNFDQQTVATLIPNLKLHYTDISDVSIDANQFVAVKATDLNDQSANFIVDPSTGKALAIVAPESEFFNWVTAFHRSLFLKEIGRFFVGFTCFLLFLIAVSGTVLIIQRQRSFKNFFSKIVKDNFAQYYHVVLGRLMLIPIIIIALTGTILSLQRFDLIKEQKITHAIDYDALKTTPAKQISEIEIFKNISLSDLKSIEFPFSEDVEDYYTLKLANREITVNQVTGEVLTEVRYNLANQLTTLSIDLHTGRTHVIWAIILGIASANILFFIYSGFVIFWKRRSNQTRNKYKIEEAEYVILVGSENGTTFRFAKIIYQQLLANDKKVYIGQLNEYQTFAQAQHLLIMAATYGLGDAPTNASKFFTLLNKHQQLRNIDFSVLAFGSKSYADFCKYGYDIHNELTKQNWATALTEIYTVNDRSPDEFSAWATHWAQYAGVALSDLTEQLKTKAVKTQKFELVEKIVAQQEDTSFILKLKSTSKKAFTSGDLLAVYPANDHRERLYSIGRFNDYVQLSIKLHPGGLGSEFLYHLPVGSQFNAALIKNEHFHFPTKANTVIMISNGTGIAPFLGMVNEFGKGRNVHLYCGFKNEASFALYKNILSSEMDKLRHLKVAYSREGAKQYVKDLLMDDANLILQTLNSGGVLMLCGSLAMQKDVLEWLESLCKQNDSKSVSYYQSHAQILMDCY